MKTAVKAAVIALLALAMLLWTIRPDSLAALRSLAAKNTVPTGSLIASAPRPF